jgi:hypothetical protein
MVAMSCIPAVMGSQPGSVAQNAALVIISLSALKLVYRLIRRAL